MKAEIITIGDELLIGQTINSNAAWIGKELTRNGVGITRNVTISDERQEILSTIDEAFNRASLIIVTGGLGPTKDDITKETLCEYFNTSLSLRNDVLKRIDDYFKSKGREMLPSNIKQAELPDSCIVLDNFLGTASGMWFEKNGKVLVSIPGVPYEMKGLMNNEVIPRVMAMFGVKGFYHQTLMTQGIGESFLAEKIAAWEDRIYANGLSLAYLPSPGLVKLRLTSKKGAVDAEKINDFFEELEKMLPEYVYGRNGDSIFEVVGSLLRERNESLGTVESCTGGKLAYAFIKYPGASDFINNSLLTYSNEAKVEMAGVKSLTLENYGAVSEEVVKEMALGGQLRLKVDYCVAISGIAGPDGGTNEKPVGTVCIGVAHKEGVLTKSFFLGKNDRNRNIEISTLHAANMLRKVILDIN